MTSTGARVPGNALASPGQYRPGYELVAERILEHIAENDLHPGDRLPTEQGIADLLGETRSVTREAVKVLAAIGRLSVRKGAGIFVAAPPTAFSEDALAHFQPTNLDQVRMLLDYRRVIEAETARRAATIATPAQVRAIRDAAKESAEAGTANQSDAFAQADTAFHTAIAVAAQNDFLQASVSNIRRYSAQSGVLLFRGDSSGSLGVAGDQHTAIANAIAAGDSERAVSLMTEHIDTTQRQFERRIQDRVLTLTPAR